MKSTDILKKYNIQAPRYTSYPTLPNWMGLSSKDSLWKSLSHYNHVEGGIDLYVHIPYCQKLCWYCGCNRIISKNQNKVETYLDDLWSEFLIYLDKIPNLKISSIHFGGGTPNFIKAQAWNDFLNKLKPFKAQDFLGSVELDPRTLTEDQVIILANHGFKRASFGVQDFDPKVQMAINRVQSFELVKEKVNLLKKYGFNSINFDLIYGLPKQTSTSVKETIIKVKELSPDLIAFYSYAHLPERLKNQKLIKSEDLLLGEDKLNLYKVGQRDLKEVGFVEIGMDHFAKENSYLHRASLSKKLYRSFMGYTDKKKSALLGLGVSAISMTPTVYAQNEKDLHLYSEKVDSLEFAYTNGHELTFEDEITASIIQEIMCNKRIPFNQIIKLKNATRINTQLNQLIEDGLIEYGESEFHISKVGEPFLRNIAMAFDGFKDSKTQYSTSL